MGDTDDSSEIYTEKMARMREIASQPCTLRSHFGMVVHIVDSFQLRAR